MDLEKGRERVLGVGQLEGQLLFAGKGADRRERGVDVLLDRLAFLQELGQDLELLLLLPELAVVREDRFGLLELPQRLLRGDVVVPEAGITGLLLELRLLSLGTGDVKGSP